MTPPLRGKAALRDDELESFRAPQYFDFSTEAASLARYGNEATCGEDFVPGAEGVNIFRAHELLVEYPEVQGIVLWLDRLRRDAGIPVSPVDVDLTNGIALGDAMRLICPTLVEPGSVNRDYMRPSTVAKGNVALIRGALACFPWIDEVKGKNVTASVDFSDLSPWSLAAYVLAAAVNCPDREGFIKQLMEFDIPTQNLLDSTVRRVYKALGISYGEEGANYNSDDMVMLDDDDQRGQQEEDKDLQDIRGTLTTLSIAECDSDGHERNTKAANLEEKVQELLEQLEQERTNAEVLKAQICDMEEEVNGWKEHAVSLESLATDMAEKSKRAKEEIKKLKGSNAILRKKLEVKCREMTDAVMAKENEGGRLNGRPLKANENGLDARSSTMVKKLMTERQELIERAANERRENVRLRRLMKEADRKTELAEREIGRLRKIGERPSRRPASTPVSNRSSSQKR